MPAPTRYFSLPATYFTAPPTAGLSPLAACLYLRARAASLIGALQLSPRVLGLAHRVGPAEVEAAIAELVERGLARWWPDLELLLVPEALIDARGSAAAAARRQVDALPPGPHEEATALLGGVAPPPVPPPRQVGLPLADGVAPPFPSAAEGVGPNREQRTENREQRTDKPAPRVDPRAAPVLDHLDKLREGLGLRRLPPSQRVDRWIVARLDEGVSAADMLLALDLRAEEVRRDPRAARYFDAGSPFTGPGSSGPGGWAVSARMIDEAQRRGGTRGRAAAPHGAPAAEDAYQAQVAAERLADLQRREAELARTPRLAVVGGES